MGRLDNLEPRAELAESLWARRDDDDIAFCIVIVGGMPICGRGATMGIECTVLWIDAVLTQLTHPVQPGAKLAAPHAVQQSLIFSLIAVQFAMGAKKPPKRGGTKASSAEVDMGERTLPDQTNVYLGGFFMAFFFLGEYESCLEYGPVIGLLEAFWVCSFSMVLASFGCR